MGVEGMLDGTRWVVGNGRRRFPGDDRAAERIGIMGCVGHDDASLQNFDKHGP